MRAFFHPEPADIALEHVLHALSDPVRLEIVRALSDVKMAMSGELNLGRPKSSMSHHFSILRETLKKTSKSAEIRQSRKMKG